MNDKEIEDELLRIFFFYDEEEEAQLEARGSRLVHYTTADTAFKILSSRSIWMRNAVTMNDYSEIQYGEHCVRRALSSDAGKEFRTLLTELQPSMSDDLYDLFAWLTPDLLNNTFLTSFSEHRDDEDEFGRLSMWRAYGGTSGVALVFTLESFRTTSEALNVYASKVAYWTADQWADHLAEVVKRMEQTRDWLAALPYSTLLNVVTNFFRFAVVSTKHRGFEEEQEWRLIHCPNYESSPHVKSELQTVRGIPQKIHVLKIEDIPEIGLVGVDLRHSLHSVVIGPTRDAQTMGDAFVQLLTDLDVSNPRQKVRTSGIPLRQD